MGARCVPVRDHARRSAARRAPVGAGTRRRILGGSATLRLLRHASAKRLMGAALRIAMASTAALIATVLSDAPTWTVLTALFLATSTIGVTIPTATSLALLDRAETAGAGSALLGGTQYAIGGLAGLIVSLTGETGPSMSVAMGIFAAAAYAACRAPSSRDAT